jgi:inosine-uridine nucleoside N-ribohydrolase
LLAALRSAGRAVLVTLGPLTNLALALERDQRAVRRAVTRHLAMLGNFGPPASPDRVADFNAWADPEAAQRVLSAGLPTQLVPLDVTRRMVLSPAQVQALDGHGQSLSHWLALALEFSVEAHRRVRGVAGCMLHDCVVMGEILSPGTLRFRERAVALDLDEGLHRGHTRVRPDGRPIPVAASVDLERMRALLQRLLSA